MKKKKTKKPTLKELFACRSVKAIIALMKKYQIRGDPNGMYSCPLARYSTACGKSRAVAGGDSFKGPGSKIRTEFIRKFDGYKIPELIA